MGIASMVIGIVAVILMMVGMIPCLGWLNWFVLLLSIAGFILGLVYVSSVKYEQRNAAIAGIVLACVAAVLGAIRLFVGGGII